MPTPAATSPITVCISATSCTIRSSPPSWAIAPESAARRPGEPAGVSSTSDSPSRSESRTNGRLASGCTSGSATTTGSSSTVSKARPGQRPGRAQEADVEPAVVELAQLLGRAHLVQAQRDVRRLLAERAQQLGHERVHRRADEADRQPADLAALDAPRLARRVLDRVEDLARPHEERRARPRSARPCAGCAAAASRRPPPRAGGSAGSAAAGTCAGAPPRGGSAALPRRR